MMHFLIDASLPRGAGDVVRMHGHSATDVRDIGMGAAEDAQIADYAKTNGFAILSADLDFADINRFPPADYAGLVAIRQQRLSNRKIVLETIDGFLSDGNIVAALPGRLAIVELNRIRLNPPMGT